MSEYWKSTPKYWCKHCSLFVRDTKLERANHEATGKHQGAIKRSLRELHRGAEREEREKDRARREVERLNGVVSGTPGGSSSSSGAVLGGNNNNNHKFGGAQRQGQQTQQGQGQGQGQQVTEAERQRQLEQLAELGVSIPDELRGNMAMAGEWTVTRTRVIEEDPGDQQDDGQDKKDKKAVGVKRERERTEEEKETEEALNGLLKAKKPRRLWGVDSKRMGGQEEEDQELDMLLSGGIGPLKGAKIKGETQMEAGEVKQEVKKEEGVDEGVKKEVDAIKEEELEGEVRAKVQAEGDPVVKKEPDEKDGEGLDALDAQAASTGKTTTAATTDLDLNAVGGMFKKRKGRNLKQK